jgi:hypothetical protein
MGFRPLPPQRLPDVGRSRAGPHIRARKRWGDRLTISCLCCNSEVGPPSPLPNRQAAFIDDALALTGYPCRRIDRVCIVSPPITRRTFGAISIARARRVPSNAVASGIAARGQPKCSTFLSVTAPRR